MEEATPVADKLELDIDLRFLRRQEMPPTALNSWFGIPGRPLTSTDAEQEASHSAHGSVFALAS
jgi:hypothetical protein